MPDPVADVDPDLEAAAEAIRNVSDPSADVRGYYADAAAVLAALRAAGWEKRVPYEERFSQRIVREQMERRDAPQSDDTGGIIFVDEEQRRRFIEWMNTPSTVPATEQPPYPAALSPLPVREMGAAQTFDEEARHERTRSAIDGQMQQLNRDEGYGAEGAEAKRLGAPTVRPESVYVDDAGGVEGAAQAEPEKQWQPRSCGSIGPHLLRLCEKAKGHDGLHETHGALWVTDLPVAAPMSHAVPEQPSEWTLVLDQYLRDNLLWLLNVVGWPAPGVPTCEPFNLLHTGDWVGMIAGKLADPNADRGSWDSCVAEKTGHPNCSTEELMRWVDLWLGRQSPRGVSDSEAGQ